MVHARPQASSADVGKRRKNRNSIGIFGNRNRDKFHHDRAAAASASPTRPRRATAIPRENSAAGRPPVECDPRQDARLLFGEGVDAPRGGSRSTASRSGVGLGRSRTAGKLASLFENYRIEDEDGHSHDHVELGASVNSAINRESLIRDPRMERESFRRRSAGPGGSRRAISSEVEPRPRRCSESEATSMNPNRSTVGSLRGEKYDDESQEERLHRRTKPNGGYDDEEEEDGGDKPVTRPCRPPDHASCPHFRPSLRLDDEEPLMCPSEPGSRPRSSRFDVDSTRASLMERLRENECARKYPDLSPVKNFKSSLTDCLGGMGFEPDEIAMAIASTKATSSSDAPEVVNWLGEHEGKWGKSNEGEVEHSSDSGSNSHSSCHETQYTEYTHESMDSNNTNNTHESDERVQQLKEKLNCMGFSKDEIRKNKEVYRRHSGALEPDQFIATMMDDMENEGSHPSARNEPTVTDTQRDIRHDDLIRSVVEMGFEKQKVEIAVRGMSISGAKLDVDSVLGVLIGGVSCRSGSERWAQTIDGRPHNGNTPKRSTFPIARPSGQAELSLTIEITPGQHARLLKGRQTWNAMHNGMAVSAPCIICNDILQCCPEADYVLCPDCNVVCPLVAPRRGSASARNVTDNDGAGPTSRRMSFGDHVGAVGLGYKRE